MNKAIQAVAGLLIGVSIFGVGAMIKNWYDANHSPNDFCFTEAGGFGPVGSKIVTNIMNYHFKKCSGDCIYGLDHFEITKDETLLCICKTKTEPKSEEKPVFDLTTKGGKSGR